MEDLYHRLQETVHQLSVKLEMRPTVGLVMGSGLGEVEGLLETIVKLPYEDILHFPRSTAPGHEGNLLLGSIGGCPLAVLQGRFHFYEGYSTQEITFPIRVLAAIGAKVLVVTNAAGGLNPMFRPGDIMIITDHLHMIPENPLRGIKDPRLGDRFPDMSEAYDRSLLEEAEAAAQELGILVRKGVYIAISGPSLETPAETRFFRAAGADAIGMSTTPEVIVARSLGLKVLGLSVISNVNRPDCMEPISVDSILAVCHEATPRLLKLISGVVTRIRGRLVED
ncbi:MAG: purine-nucleoside phosphorylase [Thermodesulfobacteriota bacterium]